MKQSQRIKSQQRQQAKIDRHNARFHPGWTCSQANTSPHPMNPNIGIEALIWPNEGYACQVEKRIVETRQQLNNLTRKF